MKPNNQSRREEQRHKEREEMEGLTKKATLEKQREESDRCKGGATK